MRLAWSFVLTFPLKLIELDLRLGDRPVAGRRVLVPLTEVRILVPQPFLFTAPKPARGRAREGGLPDYPTSNTGTFGYVGLSLTPGLARDLRRNAP